MHSIGASTGGYDTPYLLERPGFGGYSYSQLGLGAVGFVVGLAIDGYIEELCKVSMENGESPAMYCAGSTFQQLLPANMRRSASATMTCCGIFFGTFFGR